MEAATTSEFMESMAAAMAEVVQAAIMASALLLAKLGGRRRTKSSQRMSLKMRKEPDLILSTLNFLLR